MAKIKEIAAKILGYSLLVNLIPFICLGSWLCDKKDQLQFPHWWIPYGVGYVIDVLIFIAAALIYLIIYLINGAKSW